MSTDKLTITDQTNIAALMKEFTMKFPYLGLKVHGLQPEELDQTIGSVKAEGTTGGTIYIYGSMSVSKLKKLFKELYGLNVQVCYSPKEEGDNDDCMANEEDGQYTLAAFNKMREIASLTNI